MKPSDGGGRGKAEGAGKIHEVSTSWPGIAVRRTASLSLAYVPTIHVLNFVCVKSWMPGIKPGMTKKGSAIADRGFGER